MSNEGNIMSRKSTQRITANVFIALLAFSSSAVFAQADASFPVIIISETNDGTDPPNCSGILNAAGGPPEVSLDLDNDGIEDICLGSSSLSCSDPINLDCSASTTGNGSLCSLQNAATRLMDSDPVAASNFGNLVGPNFVPGPTSISVPLLGTPLVIGFQGVSTNPAVTGYFELQINDVDGTNCGYSFGNAYVDDGSTGINYGDISRGAATAVPTMSLYGLILTTLGLLLLGSRHLRRVRKRD
jgi:hypothetical protein